MKTVPERLITADWSMKATRTSFTPQYGATWWTHVPSNVTRKIAPLTSASQAYYWSRTWQEQEHAALADLASGKSRTFGNADEAIRYLLSDD